MYGGAVGKHVATAAKIQLREWENEKLPAHTTEKAEAEAHNDKLEIHAPVWSS